ncbi:unnamed protein product [Darwinula stevensoni]|uniref:Mitochondrial carrier protein n=1 Tax=Darwinula stevensoni TaxID=69355 RepID=A0A7R8X8A8_9CRUS|nr:unnamed protein product [Darwinula stevensoni]CAG0888577.1 unnamed protein product [Darwinula stevensoni]
MEAEVEWLETISGSASGSPFGPASPGMLTSFTAGALAGLAVDITLFPLDTVKTRLQSQGGFRASGGFRGIYGGIGPAALVGGTPIQFQMNCIFSAAMFFLTYEGTKSLLHGQLGHKWTPLTHMLSAATGEVVACIVRVPVEVIKQRRQAKQHSTMMDAVTKAYRHEGVRGFYRGYASTVMREIPFSIIQFPLWEWMKVSWAAFSHKSQVSSAQSSVCGAVAGGIAAAVTTPLDVVKTRIMLAERESVIATGKIIPTLRTIYVEKGIRGLFSGIIPRTLWISLGGAIFLGVYEKAKELIQRKIS